MLFLPLVANAFTGNVEIGDLKYSIVTKGKAAEVIGLASGKKPTEIVIPETIEYEGVTCNVISIKDRAFYKKDFIASVTIQEGVNSIGYGAFNECSALLNVTFPNGLLRIDEYCFAECKKLNELILPSGLIEIGKHAFLNCNSLTKVFVPSSLKTIGEGAFSGCYVKSVYIEDLASWCKISFYSITSNPLYYADNLFLNDKEITDLVIPQGVTSIYGNAFYGCQGLKSVTLSSSVEYVNGSAFYGCSGIKTIHLGKNLKNLYASAFEKCTEITDVYSYADIVPGYYNAVFKDSYIEYATLHVPDDLVDSYKTSSGWKNFGTIIGFDSERMPQCAKPEIHLNEGVVSFTCDTEGVKFVPEIVYTDKSFNKIENIHLASNYRIRVYATKDGYRDSEISTIEIIQGYGQAIILGDVDSNGLVNIVDHVELTKIIMNQ